MTDLSELVADRWALWSDCLNSDDKYCIVNQIDRLIWNTAFMHAINESRKYIEKDGRGFAVANLRLHHLLDDGYNESQLLAVRRLVDNYPLVGHNSVISLKSLLRDMVAHNYLLTRDNMMQQCEGDDDLKLERHMEIDLICYKTAQDRKGSDVVEEEVLHNCIKKLDASCGKIKKYVDKYLAHSSSREDRRLEEAKRNQITYSNLWAAHKTMAMIANFISQFILGKGTFSFWALSIMDPLRHLDKPIVKQEHMPAIANRLKEYEDEIISWDKWNIDDYSREIIAKT